MTVPILPPKLANIATGPRVNPTYRINVHFQPDLLYQGSVTVIDNLALTKQYLSQFKTGVSNGGLITTSHRVQWEDDLFGEFYPAFQADSTVKVDRPKYGAININGDMYGAAPRFGSCYFRLTADTIHRATFCFPDSYYGVEAVGTAEHFELDGLAHNRSMDDPLDWYIEAHIHGPILIPDDVEVLVLDPSYKATNVHKVAATLRCEIQWHEGYSIEGNELLKHETYRGAEFATIAQDLADEKGRLTPAILGKAVQSLKYDLKQTKKVWHLLARYGRLWP